MFGLFDAMRRLSAAINEMAAKFERANLEIDSHRPAEIEARQPVAGPPAPEPGQPADANGRPRAKAKGV